MQRIIQRYKDPAQVRVLDIGCAGGRNTEFLAARGFEVNAIDISRAMVERTRARLGSIVGEQKARDRVNVGRMQDLGAWEDDWFDLVLALGIYHNATDAADWECTIGETCRVLKADGLVLLSNFSPRSQPQGQPLEAVSDKHDVYTGFDSGPLYLLEADELDRRLAEFGLKPTEPTETVQAATENGYRISVNGLYEKQSQ